jgi:hypothetical protein
MKKTVLSIVTFLMVVLLNGQTLLDTAINFSVKDVYGNTLKLFDILNENKIVVIDFFAAT